MRSILVEIFLVLAITSAQCGVIIIIQDDNAIKQDTDLEKFNGKHDTIKYDDKSDEFSDENVDDWDVDDTPDLPDPKNVALMARYIVHNANWTSVAYTSHSGRTNGQPLATMFSVSDGPVNKSWGTPYFYVSRLQAAVVDLLDVDNRCSLMMSLAETDICTKKGWDPEDPRCAHVILTGTFHKMTNKSREYPIAAHAVFSRHPSFIHLPESHHFFIAKFNIEGITIQDTFGGPSEVSVNDYFNAKSAQFNIAQSEFYSYVPEIVKDDNFIPFPDQEVDGSDQDINTYEKNFPREIYSVYNI